MSTRNFCIIAHVDHGKSTLADRLLEVTGTVSARDMRAQLLDQMDIERERGITIKLQPVRMTWDDNVLNLIDTPGHVDFQYEVGRSLAAVEGAVLLVDATQGIQAQTLSVLYAALDQNLTIIPAVNKIDLPAADADGVAAEIAHLLGIPAETILRVSGKTGAGVPELLDRIVRDVPPAAAKPDSPARCLVFDSVYDPFRGAIAFVRVVEGRLLTNDQIFAMTAHTETAALELGYFKPGRVPTPELVAGDIGYVVTQFKDVRHVRVGDTLGVSFEQSPLPGYRTVTPMVYASLFPLERSEINRLRESLEKLALNDASLTYVPENNPALGSGFRAGFLGVLHLEIIRERLEREYNLELFVTTPTVSYQARLTAGDELLVTTSADWPDPSMIAEAREPMAAVEVVVPAAYIGAVMELGRRHRGEHKNTEYLDQDRAVLTFSMPLAELIVTFHDELKSATAGFGSLSYELAGYRPQKLSKVDILIAGSEVPPLSQIVPTEIAESHGRRLCERLKNLLPRQQFATPVQATISGKIIARETVPAFRKDVTAKLYGGDVTRKRKLLEKQKKGKKRMAEFGNVAIPPSVFLDVLKPEP